VTGQLIIDCDPGLDDAIALMLAVRARLPLLGVTTAAGNGSLASTTQNACKLLAYAGRPDIPVYAGQEKPLRPSLPAAPPQRHGDELDRLLGNLPADTSQRLPAADYLVGALHASSLPVTLACIGPLTNIAAAFQQDPSCARHVERLIIMGGAVRAPGNVTPTAEFNFHFDPHAARAVLGSGCDIFLHPLDVTMKALVYQDDIDRMVQSQSRFLSLAGKLLRANAARYHPVSCGYSSPVHDALCIAVLLQDHLVIYEPLPLDVDPEGRCFITQQGSTVFVADTIDRTAFVSLLTRTLA